MKGPWVKLWRNVFADEKVAFIMRRYGHEAGIMWIGILSQAEDGVLNMDEDIFADLVQIEEKRYQELRGVLVKRGLVVENADGLLEVPNWDEYQTGESTERVRAYRERRKNETLRNGSATEMQRVEVEVEVENTHTPSAEAEAVREPDPVIAQEVAETAPARRKPGKSGEEKDELYAAVWDSCLAMSGDQFSNYPREGEGCKRFCRLVRSRSPTNPEAAARAILETFRRLRDSGDRFWSRQPFTPSVLASAGIFDRLVLEAGKAVAMDDQVDQALRDAAARKAARVAV